MNNKASNGFLAILIILALVFGGPIGFVRAEPIKNTSSIDTILKLLQNNPIESELRAIGSTAKTLTSSLSLLDSATGVLDTIDEIKQNPVLWKTLITGMNILAPGSGTTLEQLDSELRAIIELKNDLSKLNNLETLAKLIETFKKSATQANLNALVKENNKQLPSLLSLQSRVKSEFDKFTKLINDIQSTQSAVRKTINKYSLGSSTINELDSQLTSLLSQVKSAYSTLQAFSNPLNHIVGVMIAIRDGNSQIVVDCTPGISTNCGTAGSTTASGSPKLYFPLNNCNASYLHVGDYVIVTYGGGKQGIRSNPDTHPADNIIARIPEGGGMTIIGGPVCNYGWILWKVKTDSGVTGWTPEGNGKAFWLTYKH